MSVDLYYTPPSDEMFDEIKRAAIEVWQTFDDEFGYATEKIDRIKDISNIGDNYMYMVSMFDWEHQQMLFDKLKPETFDRIKEAVS